MTIEESLKVAYITSQKTPQVLKIYIKNLESVLTYYKKTCNIEDTNTMQVINIVEDITHNLKSICENRKRY